MANPTTVTPAARSVAALRGLFRPFSAGSTRLSNSSGPSGRLRAVAVLLLTGLGVAVSLWLQPSSVHLVEWGAERPQVVLLLPALWKLIGACALVVIIGTVLYLRADCSRVRRLAYLFAPCLLLWLLVLPYVPGVLSVCPLLIVLAGPLKYVVFVVACAGVAGNATGWRGVWPVSWMPTRFAILGLTFVVYLSLGMHAHEAVGPTGDEPHYLVLTHSLWVDGDIRIENNHRQRDYAGFFPGELRPDYVVRGRDGEIYSVHAPGLPALLVPGYAIAGYAGALATVALMAAWIGSTIFEIGLAVAGPRVALVSWAALAFTIPMIPMAWMLYPEVPAALIVARATLWLVAAPRTTPWQWFWRGVALAILPWLHTKFALLLAGLVPLVSVHAWKCRRSIVAFCTPVAISLAGWLSAFFLMYGTFDPRAPYPLTVFPRTLANVPRGMLGLAFDQQFGVLLFAPIYMLLAVGLWCWRREVGTRWMVWGLALLAGAYLVGVTRPYMWWGGSSPRGRFVIPLIPIAVPLIALAVARLRGPVGRGLVTAAIAWGASITMVGLFDVGRRLFESRRDVARLIEAVQGAAPIDAVVPSFFGEDWATPAALMSPWVIAGALGLLLVHGSRGLGGPRADRPYWSGVLGAGTILVGGLIAAAPGVPLDARDRAVAAGRATLVRDLRGAGQWALAFPSLERLTDTAALNRAAFELELTARRVEPGLGTLFGPLNLGPGDYVMQIRFDRPFESIPNMSVVYHLGRFRGTVARSVSRDEGVASVAFTLPTLFRGLWLRVPRREEAIHVRSVRIVPARAAGEQAADVGEVREIHPLNDARDAVVMHVDDSTLVRDDLYGVRRNETGTVLVSGLDEERLGVTLTNSGPVRDEVRLSSGEWAHTVILRPGEHRTLVVPGAPAARVVLSVTTTARVLEAEESPRLLRPVYCLVRLSAVPFI